MSWITTTFTSYQYSYIAQPGWDAGARSIASIPADGGFQFKVGQATGIVCGLNSVDESASYLEIDHGFFIEESRFRVIEQGVTKTGWFSYTKDQVFSILRFLGVISYYVNDVLIYTSTTPSTGSVFLDCSLYSYLDSIIDSCAVMDYSTESGGISIIDVSLLPLVAIGTTEEDNYAFVDLLPLTASGTVTDVNTIEVSVSPLAALGVSGDLNFSEISLLPLTVLAEETRLVPDYNSISIDLRPLQVYGLQYDPDPAYLEGSLLPLTAIGDADGGLNSLQFQIRPLQVEAYLGASNYFSVVWSIGQVSIIQVGGDLSGNVRLPALELDATAVNRANGADLNLPALNFSAFTGAVARLSPLITLSASATNPGYATAELVLVALNLAASASPGDVAEALLTLPALELAVNTGATAALDSLLLELTAAGTVIEIARAELALPGLVFSATAQTGLLASATLELPVLEFSASGTVNGLGSAVLTLPALILDAYDALSVAETSYAINLSTGAVTQLILGSLGKLVTAHGRLYGLQGDQLVVLSGDTDQSAPIPATVRFAPQPFGSNRAKRMSAVYLNAREDDGLTLTLVADEVATWRYQTPTDTAPAYGTHKVKVGRGVKFHTAGIVLQNRNGGKMDIGGMEVLINEGTPRPKS